MHEIVPVALGAAVALACRRLQSPWLRRSLFAALILLAAAVASFVNGEPVGWPLFIAADVCFALAGAVGARLGAGPLWYAARGLWRTTPPLGGDGLRPPRSGHR